LTEIVRQGLGSLLIDLFSLNVETPEGTESHAPAELVAAPQMAGSRAVSIPDRRTQASPNVEGVRLKRVCLVAAIAIGQGAGCLTGRAGLPLNLFEPRQLHVGVQTEARLGHTSQIDRPSIGQGLGRPTDHAQIETEIQAVVHLGQTLISELVGISRPLGLFGYVLVGLRRRFIS
jgi:hypothetical protein